MKFFKLVLIFSLAILLNSCAKKQDFTIQNTKKFEIFSVSELKSCKDKMFVYIEGDGNSWIDKNTPSKDPTPNGSVSIKLMQVANNSCSIYLARPCQYSKKECKQKYWTSHKYSYEVIKTYQEILDSLKKEHKISSFVLVGHSGGGVIASLLASQRDDVFAFITIASNLDTTFWTKLHNISPLRASLNPAEFTYILENIPQYHLIGEKDKIVPPEVFASYYSKVKNKEKIFYKIYPTDHTSKWEKIYKEFLEEKAFIFP